MYSPLKVRYDLLQKYKQIKEVRLFILPSRDIGVLLELYPDQSIDYVAIEKSINQGWFERYVIANDKPAVLNDSIDVLEEAQALNVDLDEIMDQRTHERGATHFVSRYLSRAEVRVETRIHRGHGTYIAIYIADEKLNTLSEDNLLHIRRLVRLLLCSLIPLEIVPLSTCQTEPRKQHPIDRVAHQDQNRCIDLIPNALKGDSLRGYLKSLYSGNNLYIDSFPENKLDLATLLPLANTLYLSIPPTREWYNRRIGFPTDELKRLVFMGRIVPVFECRLDIFEKPYLEELIEIAPSSILPGELRLRVVQAMHRIEPVVIDIERRTEDAMNVMLNPETSLRSLQETKAAQEILKRYLNAANESAGRLRQICTTLEPIVHAIYPLLDFSDALLRQDFKARKIELPPDNVLQLATAYRVWIYAHALYSEAVIHKGDPLEFYHNLYFSHAIPSPLIKIGEKTTWILSRLGLLKANQTLAEQASFTLDSDVIAWIRQLLLSPRLDGENWKSEFFNIEREEQGLKAKMNHKTWLLWLVQSIIAAASIPGLGGLAVPKAIEIGLQGAGIPLDERLTKPFSSQPEARLLFKIHSRGMNTIPIGEKSS